MKDVFTTPFAQTVFLQKYSKDGVETWADCCKRVTDAVCSQLLTNKDKEKIYNIMLERKFIPGGRYLYSSGRPYHQVNNCHDGDTKIVTKNGIRALKELLGQPIEVLNRHGEWEQATVCSFGVQPLQMIVFDDGRTVLATEGHRWWQENGERVTTKELKAVPVAPAAPVGDMDQTAIRHGIIFGDGQLDYKTRSYTYVVLIGAKEELHTFFSDTPIERKGKYGNIRLFAPKKRIKAGLKVTLQPGNYKDLPDARTCTPEYARGFIAGLIATDGSTKTTSVTISCEGFKLAQSIAELAVLGGCRVSRAKVISRINPFNGKGRELSQITLENKSAPIIRADQVTNVKSQVRPLKVVDIFYSGRTEETYCVVAPKSESFTLANGLITSNCFLFRAEDSREGWAEIAQKATASLMTGGGIGVDYSALRPKGGLIKRTGGVSTGPLALMHLVNESGRFIMQGGQRRSAIWAGLNWSHPDIRDFMALKNYPDGLKALKSQDLTFPVPMELTNISVIYDTEFFIAIEDEQHPKHLLAKEVWSTNCRQAFTTAEPGMSFNFRKDNESLRNAPVSGNTRVLTAGGYRFVRDLVGVPTHIWTGKRYAQTTFKLTKRNSALVRVDLSNGRHVICDPEHPFIAKDYQGAGERKKVLSRRVAAKDLVQEQKIFSDLPQDAVSTRSAMEYGYGFVYGDGSIRNGRGELSFHTASKRGAFLCAVDGLGARVGKSGNRAYFKTNLDSKSELLGDLLSTSFIAGWFDADGCYTRELLRISNKDKAALHALQESLDFYGIKSVVREDGVSGYRRENVMYTLGVASESLLRFRDLIKTIRIHIDLPDTFTSYREHEIRVVAVTELEDREDVYCCDVGFEEHSFMADGVIVSNCTEVTSEDDSDKCNLGTVWINRAKDKKDFAETVKSATLFLLCGSIYSDVPTDRIRIVGLKNNRIGVGLGGIHDWLIERGHSYECVPELHKWLAIYEQETDGAAFVGAKNLGIAVPKGVRAVAPTGSIGIMAETTTGIEPLFCKSYKRRYFRDGGWSYQYVVDGAIKRLIDKGHSYEKIQDSFDISFKDRVKFQADVQNYVDMAISSTCNMPAWGTDGNNESTLPKNAATLLRYAKRLRGFTVYPDGCRGGQPLTRCDLKEALENEGKVFEEREDTCIGGVCGV